VVWASRRKERTQIGRKNQWTGDFYRSSQNTMIARNFKAKADMNSKKTGIIGTCSTHGTDELCKKMWLGKPEGKRPQGRPRHRWEDNIRMDVREIEYKCMEYIHPVQDRNQRRTLVNTVKNLWVS
jgi:hypothetical protein